MCIFPRWMSGVAVAALLGATGSFALAQDKKPLTFGELQTIRVMAGGMVGEALGQTLGKNMLGIIANRSAICSTLSGGVGSGFLRTNAKGAVTMESIKEPVEAAAAVERMLPADALYLAFGGEWKKEDNVAMLEKVLEELAANQYKGTIVFHVTTWAQKQPQEIASRNARVAAYLRQADIRVGTLNLDAKKAVLNRAALEGDQWKLTPLGEVPMRDDLVALFRRA
jgi:hypothetical protein